MRRRMVSTNVNKVIQTRRHESEKNVHLFHHLYNQPDSMPKPHKWNDIFLLLLLATFASNRSYAQDFEVLNKQSKELIEQEKFQEAYPILLKAAELGESEAQYNLDICCRAAPWANPICRKPFVGINNHPKTDPRMGTMLWWWPMGTEKAYSAIAL